MAKGYIPTDRKREVAKGYTPNVRKGGKWQRVIHLM